MLVWSKSSVSQLQILERNIKNTGFMDKKELKLIVKESNCILKNKSLDINNEMELLEEPLIISACIYTSKPFIEMLLRNGVNPNKTYNPFIAYNENNPTVYCKNEWINGLDILNRYKKEFSEIVKNVDAHKSVREELSLELLEIDKCINLLIKFGGIPNKKT